MKKLYLAATATVMTTILLHAQEPPPQDWYQRYVNVRPSSYPSSYYPYYFYSYGLTYAFARPVLKTYWWMYEKSRDAWYLDQFVVRANQLFDATHFTDYRWGEPNGYDDGFKGWGAKWVGNNDLALPFSVQQNTWYHFRFRVEGIPSTSNTHIRLWINSILVFDEVYNPNRPSTIGAFPKGTVALLSGWAITRFKNITVYDLLTNSFFYDLNESISTFDSDWERVAGENPIDTGEWLLNVLTGEVFSDAATTNPSFYDDPNGRGLGKYSALVLVREGATDIEDYEVEFDMKIERRNNTFSESGIAVKYTNPSQNEVTAGYVTNEVYGNIKWFLNEDYSEEGFDGEPYTILRNYFYNPAKYIVAKIRPHNIFNVAIHGEWSGGRSWWIAPLDNFPPNNPRGCCGDYTGAASYGHYEEAHTYDGEITGEVLRFVKLVYDNPVELSLYLTTADNYLLQVEDNIIPKWYYVEGRETQNFIYGNSFVRGKLGYSSAWQNSFFLNNWLGRYGEMFNVLHKITKYHYDRWASIPRQSGIPDSALVSYYEFMMGGIMNEFFTKSVMAGTKR